MASPTAVRKPPRIQFDHRTWDAPAINRTVNRIQDALGNTLDDLVRRANNPGPQVVTAVDVVSGALPIGASASEVDLGGPGRLAKCYGPITGGQSQINAVAASAYVAAVSTALVAGGVLTVIPFDTKDYDSSSALTTGAAAKFTAPIAGVYHFNCWVNISITTAAFFYLTAAVGGAPYRRGFQLNAPALTYYGANLSGDVYLAAGQVLDFRYSLGTGGAGIMNGLVAGAEHETYCSIHRIAGS